MTQPAPSLSEARRALARSIGLAAFIYGYPLIELYRTCRLQTDPQNQRRSGASAGFRGPSRSFRPERCRSTPGPGLPSWLSRPSSATLSPGPGPSRWRRFASGADFSSLRS